MIKAVAMLSGGIDSILAAKLIQEQNIELTGVFVHAPFYQNKESLVKLVEEHARFLNIPLHIINTGKDYFTMLKSAKYGYGKGYNPCIDCRIYMFQKAALFMKEIGAEFMVTGEVPGQRPMSQLKRQLMDIERESGLEKRIVRPLAGGYLESTIPGLKGWISKNKMLNIHGRGKKQQEKLARSYGIEKYSSLSGGCLLTEKKFSLKIKDLLDHKNDIEIDDLELLGIGRHFRYHGDKIIVGRNHEENEILRSNKGTGDALLEIENHAGPVTLLFKPLSKNSLEFAAGLTALYATIPPGQIEVTVKKGHHEKILAVHPIEMEEAKKYNLSLKGFNAKKEIID